MDEITFREVTFSRLAHIQVFHEPNFEVLNKMTADGVNLRFCIHFTIVQGAVNYKNYLPKDKFNFSGKATFFFVCSIKCFRLLSL